MAERRVTQVVVESLEGSDVGVVATQSVVEALGKEDQSVHYVTQNVTEALTQSGPRRAFPSQLVVEVLCLGITEVPLAGTSRVIWFVPQH